jgi:hypothetical protein
MLEFAIAYQDALDIITGDREMKLRQYKLDEEEWDTAQELCKVLKVQFCPFSNLRPWLTH